MKEHISRFTRLYQKELSLFIFMITAMISVFYFWIKDHHTGEDIFLSFISSLSGIVLMMFLEIQEQSVVVKKRHTLFHRIMILVQIHWWQIIAIIVIYGVLAFALWRLYPQW